MSTSLNDLSLAGLGRHKKPLIVGAATAVIIIVVLVAWIFPEGKRLSSDNAQKTQLVTQQVSLEAELAQLQHEKQSLPTECSTLATQETEVPSTAAISAFYQQVTNLAILSGNVNTPSLSVTSAGPSTGSTPGAPSGVEVVGVSLSLSGDYGQISSFVHGLDSFPRIFTISQISVGGGTVVQGGSAVGPGASGYTVALTGAIYYSTSGTNVCTKALTASAS